MTTPKSGVSGFSDWKFWAVLCLYFLSCVFFFESGITRRGFYVVFPFLMAYVTMSTIAWEYRIVGSPSRPHTLLLHIAFGVSLMFYFNRVVFSFGDNVSAFFEYAAKAAVPGAVRTFGGGEWVIETVTSLSNYVFTTVASVLVFTTLSAILVLRRSWSLPLLATLMLFLSLLTFRLGLMPSVGMICGLVAGYAAFRLQMEDSLATSFWNTVMHRFSGAVKTPRIVTEMKLDLLGCLFESQRLHEPVIRGVLSKRVGTVPSDPRMTGVCRLFVEELADKDGLAVRGEDARGQYIAIRQGNDEDGIFARMAIIPKCIIVMIFTVLYILSPIDLIPDSIPVFGVMDDLVVGVVGMTSSVFSLLGFRHS